MTYDIIKAHTLLKRSVCISLFLLFLAWSLNAQTGFPSEPGQLTADIVIGGLDITYNGEEREVSVSTVPAGLPVKTTYMQNGNTVAKPLHAGTYEVTATVNTSQYTGKATAIMKIAPKRISVQASDMVKLNGSADPELAYVVSPKLYHTDILSGKLEREEGEANGTYAIRRGTLDGDTDYQIVEFIPGIFTIKDSGFPVEPGTLPLKVTLNLLRQEYDGLPKKPQLSTDIILSDPQIEWVFTRNAEVTDAINAGTYKVKAVVTATEKGQNYKGETHAELIITPRALVLIPDNVTKIYGDDTPVLTYTLSEPLVGNDKMTGALAVEGRECGEFLISAGSISAGTNYILTVREQGKLTIKPRPVTIAAMAAEKVYGNSDPVLSWTLAYGSLAYEDKVMGELSRVAGEQAGSYAITRNTLGINPNYAVTFVPGLMKIAPRPVTIAADRVEKPYGVSDPELTWRIVEGNLVYEDQATGELVRTKGEALGSYDIEQGTLWLSANYSLSFKKGVFTIGRAIVKVTPVMQTKIYGDSDPQLTYTCEAPSAGYSLSGELVRKNGEQVGEYLITMGTLAINEPQYELAFEPGKLNITPRPITVSAHPAAKIYGETDPGLTYSLSEPLRFGDTLSGSLEREEGETVGTYAIVQGSFRLNSNYTLNYQENKLTISPRTVKVISQPAVKVYGDADPVISYICQEELPFGDSFTGTPGRNGGEQVGEYVTTPGTLAISSDYHIDFVPATFNIIPRLLEVEACSHTKVFGSDDPVFTYHVGGMGLSGDDTLSGSLLRTEGEDCGEYEIVAGSLSCNGNYQITRFSPGVLAIEKAVPQINIGNLQQVYDRLPKKVTVTTDPEGLECTVLYDGKEALPVEVGNYEVSVTANGKNHTGGKKAILEIAAPEANNMSCTDVISRSGLGEKGFVITYDEFASDTHLVFYNSRGKVVYDRKNYLSGEFMMDTLAVGTYYYLYTFTDARGAQRKKSGFVEVVE